MAIKPYSQSNYGALSAVEQDDGSFNYPIYGVQANTYTGGENLQDVYGTAAMPMFQWVERIQTGQGSFNPKDPADNDMLRRYEDYLKNNPQVQMDRIYSYLEIKSYEHTFDKINQVTLISFSKISDLLLSMSAAAGVQ